MGRRKKAETYEPHDLLDEDCRHYIESAITNYHNICKNFFDHIEFLNFWFNHIEKAPTPQNTALCAFGFFKQDSLAENYLKKIRKHYNHLCDPTRPEGVSQAEWEESDTIKKYKRGQGIAQWIKSYQSREPYGYIAIDDIDWSPIAELTQREKNIALELSFGWSVARLWQLLKRRNKEYFVERFLGITVKKNGEYSSIENKTLGIVPNDLVISLANINPEEEPFFERYLHFFSPEYLNNEQLCNFWKKACISSIDGLSKECAHRQPLDKIWLLARFFNVHFYSLDFIEANRGIPARAVKQFETLANPSLLNKITKEKISTLSKKDYRKWGRKGLPPEEIFSTLANNQDLSILKDMADGILPEFQNDNLATLYKNSVSITTESTILNNISFFIRKKDSEKKKRAVEKFWVMVQNNQSSFISAYMIISLFDYLWTNLDSAVKDENSDEILEEKSKETNNKSHDIDSTGFCLFFFASAFSWSLEHEKNFFLVSNNDFEKSFWEKLPAFTNIMLLLICIYKLNKSNSKTP
ncbi:hypothetical protein [Fibrobacter sp. UWR2]|uniref:hypothetical protein n=1 Tax=Fibrobacter sp. UWR2 TaxID=1964352 RepID=UPI000B5215AE|nr:hypothetical protein [Fibrobacter sp. UWR2]OWU98659.1 hypothetical protein B7994_13260 [Fibrobacter sp. UWR2]